MTTIDAVDVRAGDVVRVNGDITLRVIATRRDAGRWCILGITPRWTEVDIVVADSDDTRIDLVGRT